MVEIVIKYNLGDMGYFFNQKQIIMKPIHHFAYIACLFGLCALHMVHIQTTSELHNNINNLSSEVDALSEYSIKADEALAGIDRATIKAIKQVKYEVDILKKQ